jgi:hypothetical protein
MRKLTKKQRRERAALGQKGFMEKTTPEWRRMNAQKAAKARWSKK